MGGVAVALALAACAEPVDWFAPTPPPVAGEWNQYRLEPTHAGVAPAGTEVGPALSLTWRSDSYAIGDYSASKGSPSLSDDLVYVGIDDGILRALDRATGALVWEFRTRAADDEAQREDSEHRGIHGTPAVADGRVFIGAYDGWIYALDAADGSLLWDRHLGDSIGASPVLYQGHVLMAVEYGAPDGRVFVLRQSDGRKVYVTPRLGDHPHSSVTVDPTRGWFFVGANNGRFSAFDLVEEQLVWEFQMPEGGEIKSTAAIFEDTVLVTSWDDRLHALDIDTGRERFSFQTLADTMSSPSVLDGMAVFGSHDGRVYAIDADPAHDYADDQDRELWHHATDGWVLSSATIVEDAGVALIGSNDGTLRMLDLADGSLAWSVRLDGVVSSVPVVTGESVFVTDGSGTTWRFDMP
ncbi:MAG: hypothetical protein D6798_01245 [Deltaproteobacteria bacterium]|nr:MAG: hypothetical protein D6798_01245 [Deltaproteobacteria bacterium]